MERQEGTRGAHMIDLLPDTLIEHILSFLRCEPLRRCHQVCHCLHDAAKGAVVLSAERRWRAPRPGLDISGLSSLENQHYEAMRLAASLGHNQELHALVDSFKALDKAVVASSAHKIALVVVTTLRATLFPINVPTSYIGAYSGEAPVASVRRGGLRLLKALPGWATKRYATLILSFLADGDQHVRNAACRALPFSRLGVEFIEAHQSTLVDAHIKNDALQQAIDALATLEPEMLARHEASIRAHAHDNHECVRNAVERALAKIADWRVTVELPPLQRDARRPWSRGDGSSGSSNNSGSESSSPEVSSPIRPALF